MSALTAEALSLRYQNRVILREVALTLQPGELLGLVGPNGAGKSTLLRILAGVQAADTGRVQLDGRDLGAWPERALARQRAYLEQQARVHWPLAVEHAVGLGRLPHKRLWEAPGRADRAVVAEAMRLAAVDHLAGRLVTALSGGEQLRVLLARVFATQPTVILADEPVAALDPYHQLHVMELLRGHCRRGGSVLVVMHDLALASRFCDRLLVLEAGRVIGCDTPAQLWQGDTLDRVYRVDFERLHGEAGLVIRPARRHGEAGGSVSTRCGAATRKTASSE